MRSRGRRLASIARLFFYSLGGALFLLLPLAPAAASALTTETPTATSSYHAEWIDRGHVRVFEGHRGPEGKIFTDNDPDDGTHHFVNLDQNEDCRSTLSTPMSSAEANFQNPSASIGYLYSVVKTAATEDFGAQCELRFNQNGIHAPGETEATTSNLDDTSTKSSGGKIVINKTSDGLINFQRESDTSISRIGDNKGFTRFENTANYYESGTDDCRDRITVEGTKSVEGRTIEYGTYQERSGNAPGCKTDKSLPAHIRPADDPDVEALVDAGLDSEGGTETKATCEASGLGLAWLFCPLVNGLAEASEYLFDNFIKPFLRTSVINVNDTSDPVYQVWSSFRIIANVLLVAALLVIVLGQSIGGGIVDAYTAKKVLPRLLAAAILINISIYLVAFLVDLTNILGEGVGRLITAPFAGSDYLDIKPNWLVSAGGLAAFVGGTFAVVAIAGLASFLWLFVLLPGFVAMIGVFITLILRQGIILFLIIVSPVAFALYCLPNTEKYFKKWWDLLFKALLVYPIIVAMFAVANILSTLIGTSNATSGPRSTLAQIAAIVVMLIPLFLIPFAFKMAGGAVASLYGAVAGWGKKGTEAYKGNANDPWSRRNVTRRRMGDSVLRARERGVNYGSTMQKGNRGFLGRRAGGLIAGLSGGSNFEAARSRMNKEQQELVSNQVGTGGDNLVRALFAKQLKYRDADGKEQTGWFGTGARVDENGFVLDAKKPQFSDYEVSQSRALLGSNASGYQAALTYEMTKVGDDEEYGELMQRNIDNFQGKDNFASAIAPDSGFIWTGSTYANQNARKEGKHVKMVKATEDGVSEVTGKAYKAGDYTYEIDHAAAARDISENVQNYPLSSMKTSTPAQMRDSYDWATDIVTKGVGTDNAPTRTRTGKKITDKVYADAQRTISDLEAAATSIDQRYGGGIRQQGEGDDAQVVVDPAAQAAAAAAGVAGGAPTRISTGAAGKVNEEINQMVDHILGPVNATSGQRDKRDTPVVPSAAERSAVNIRDRRRGITDRG